MILALLLAPINLRYRRTPLYHTYFCVLIENYSANKIVLLRKSCIVPLFDLLKLNGEHRAKPLNVMTELRQFGTEYMEINIFALSLQFASTKYGYPEESLFAVISCLARILTDIFCSMAKVDLTNGINLRRKRVTEQEQHSS